MELNKSNIKKILLIITFTVLLFCAVLNLGAVLGFIHILFGFVEPFLIGLAIAFIVNVPMRFIEDKLFRFPAGETRGRRILQKLRRPLSLIVTVIFVLGVIALVMFLIIPELARTFGVLAESFPYFVDDVQMWARQFSDRLPQINEWLAGLELNWNKLGDALMDFIQNGAGNVIGSTVNAATSLFNGIFKAVLALIFAFYVLMRKEKLSSQARRILYAYLPEARADKLLSVLALSNRTFAGFLSGQCTEAVILGTLCFIGMSIFRFPYALMISVLVGFTALIPVFGAFIGVAIGAFLILMQSPMQALWFVVFFIVLQQLEGNIIYPRVVGTSVGLPSLWVLVAVTLGGSTMGIVGMLAFIPLFAVLYTLFGEIVTRRLEKRSIAKDKLSNQPYVPARSIKPQAHRPKAGHKQKKQEDKDNG